MTAIPFIPKFARYPAVIASRLMAIARAQALVEAASILPPQDDILRVSSLAETVHYSTLLEGNELSRIEAERALRHELDARGRAELELVNYVAALERIEAAGADIRYEPEFILELHGLISRGMGRKGAGFEPRHEGAWRDGMAVVPGPMGVIEHVGAPAGDLADHVRGLCEYLEARHAADEYPGPILAGIAHHALTDLHPFADGNGRTARAFAFAVLVREGVMTRRLISPDRHYALDKPAYLTALRSAKRPGGRTDVWVSPGGLEEWLVYYTTGLAEEYERMAQRVAGLNHVAERVHTSPLQLTPSQAHMVSVLSAGERQSVSRREYQEIERVSEDTAQREIAALTKARLLVARGRGRGVRYELPSTGASGGRWSPESIEQSLRAFIADRTTWPSRQEFLDAGLGGLYVAMSRYGGIGQWRRRIGF